MRPDCKIGDRGGYGGSRGEKEKEGGGEGIIYSY
jgi:hypothetical protein